MFMWFSVACLACLAVVIVLAARAPIVDVDPDLEGQPGRTRRGNPDALGGVFFIKDLPARSPPRARLAGKGGAPDTVTSAHSLKNVLQCPILSTLREAIIRAHNVRVTLG
jgi:hypothetical protein